MLWGGTITGDLIVSNTISEGGTLLSSKYLGILGKATDADKLDNLDSTYFTNATNLSTGTLPSGRIVGDYSGITGLGDIAAGAWKSTAVGTQYGGTGQNWSATSKGSVPYFSADGTMSAFSGGTAGQFLKSQGTDSAPTWTNTARTATFVVATTVANGGSLLSQQQADYVCDGIDDEDTIADAITALPDDGGKIILLEGTFNFTGVAWSADILTITKSNVIIEGQGKATHIKVVGNEGKYVIFFNGVSNCVIKDVWVDGNDLGGYAIQFTDSSECKILNCVAGNTWADGIVGTNLSYSLIKGNIVYDCETSAHGDSSSGIELEDGCNHINVEDNYVSDCGNGIWPKRHSGSPLTHDISIVRNILYNSPIYLTSEDTSPIENINVIGNTLLGAPTGKSIIGANVIKSTIKDNVIHNPSNAIDFDGSSDYILIEGNKVYNSTTHGITVHGERCNISNNYVFNTATHGLYLAGSYNTASNNQIFDAGSNGIQSNSSGDIISNNYVKDAVNVGIFVAGSKCMVHGNYIEGSGSRGIYINSSQTSIIGNLVKNSTGSGIRTQNQQNVVFIGNVCFDDQGAKTQTYGIDLDECSGTCDNNTVIGNNVAGNKNGGITITAGSNANTIIKDNIGYTTKNSGNSTGTGAQQTIAHSLVATPTKVILWDIEDGANPYQSDTANGTNILITAVAGKNYGWQAEVE